MLRGRRRAASRSDPVRPGARSPGARPPWRPQSGRDRAGARSARSRRRPSASRPPRPRSSRRALRGTASRRCATGSSAAAPRRGDGAGQAIGEDAERVLVAGGVETIDRRDVDRGGPGRCRARDIHRDEELRARSPTPRGRGASRRSRRAGSRTSDSSSALCPSSPSIAAEVELLHGAEPSLQRRRFSSASSVSILRYAWPIASRSEAGASPGALRRRPLTQRRQSGGSMCPSTSPPTSARRTSSSNRARCGPDARRLQTSTVASRWPR